MYNRNTFVWGSYDERRRHVKDLTDDHVVNIINWIRKYPQDYGAKAQDLIDFFEGEARHKAFLAFAANKPMPIRTKQGFWVMGNMTRWQRTKHAIRNRFYRGKAEEARAKALGEDVWGALLSP